MGKEYVEGPLDFFEALADGKRISMDIEVYHQVIKLLLDQESKESDPQTRKAIHSTIEQMARPILDADIDETDDRDVTFSGTVLIDESVQRKMLNALISNNTSEQTHEVLKSIIPNKAVISNSKLAQEITRDFIGAGEIELSVGSAKKPLTVVAALAYDDPALSIKGRHPFTSYDRTVYNGVCSLYQAGNKHFTAAMVYRAMNGITADTRKLSPQAVGAVTRSIEKLRVTKLTIDCTEQMKAYPNIRQGTLDDMLLSAKKVSVINHNGEKQEAYAFNTIPILYEYSQSIGQVLSVPPRLLNSSKTINTTDEIIVLREYLIRRIEGMKGRNGLRSDSITFATIYKELDIDINALAGNAVKDVPKRVRKNTEALLSHFVSESFIKGYTIYKNGRTIAGIRISL